MKVKEYLEQNDIMVIQNLPKYTYAISSLHNDKGPSLLLSFSIAHPDILEGNKLSDKEKMIIAGDQEIMGQIAIPLQILKNCIKQMERE